MSHKFAERGNDAAVGLFGTDAHAQRIGEAIAAHGTQDVAAAIRDQAFVQQAVSFNQMWVETLTRALEAIGLKVTPSVANFVLIHFPEIDGKRAADADEFLTSRGYILRAVRGYGFANALRMSIGPEEANRGVIAALSEFMGHQS